MKILNCSFKSLKFDTVQELVEFYKPPFSTQDYETDDTQITLTIDNFKVPDIAKSELETKFKEYYNSSYGVTNDKINVSFVILIH